MPGWPPPVSAHYGVFRSIDRRRLLADRDLARLGHRVAGLVDGADTQGDLARVPVAMDRLERDDGPRPVAEGDPHVIQSGRLCPGAARVGGLYGDLHELAALARP